MSNPRSRLTYVSDTEPGYTRQRRGKHFVYLDRRGRTLSDERVLARIRSLAIPPAYTDVWICRSPNGHVQATARDARGRKQYRYHPGWKAWRDATKFERTLDFARVLPKLRARIARDLRRKGLARERVLATILRLLDRTHARIGNEEYARSNRSYGLSTLRDRHAKVRGDEVLLHFRGKSGKDHQVMLTDARVARVVRRCEDLPGQHLFQYRDEQGALHRVGSGDVNEYLRGIVGNGFTAKDFRTWAATVSVAGALIAHGRASQAMLRGAIEHAANELGNTPAVCRRAYVHPAIMQAYESREEAARLRAAYERAASRRGRGLNQIEKAVLIYLQERARSRRAVTDCRAPVAGKSR
ncbi:MAG TPA: DNA topoisomerase IB [Rhodanobacteraceae bacterium]|nr:DNA topoisomerase IB [Rhodanobacteraceae bacterium]